VRIARPAAAVLAGAVALGGGAWALGTRDASTAASTGVRASIDDWRWAPRDAEEPPAPTGEQASAPETPSAPTPPPPLPDPSDELSQADVLGNGIALPPLEAPSAVRAIFEAGNTIARSPYKWGGGHGRWVDHGYDCSGSVSYALAAAGLLDASLDSGRLMSWGRPGRGKWVTIWSNPGHVFMVVAGVRFDTTARGQTGSRWIDEMRSTDGYVARHPQGL
jgi:hypothetical protein